MLVERTPVRVFARSSVSKVRFSVSSSSSRHLSNASTSKSLGVAATSTQRRQHTPSAVASLPSRHILIRNASTASTSSPPASTPESAASMLTWDQFLALKKSRRRYNLVASVSTGVSTAFMGAGYISTMDLTQLSNMLFGIDPIIAMGLSTMGCGALGWLLGPFAGNAVFNLTHRRVKRQVMEKEKDFYHRIRKYRADISAGGNLQNNPFPDYYGEKIDSVKAYRQWLRDQRKFSKKRQYQEP